MWTKTWVGVDSKVETQPTVGGVVRRPQVCRGGSSCQLPSLSVWRRCTSTFWTNLLGQACPSTAWLSNLVPRLTPHRTRAPLLPPPPPGSMTGASSACPPYSSRLPKVPWPPGAGAPSSPPGVCPACAWISKYEYSKWLYYLSPLNATAFIKSFPYILGLSTLFLHYASCIPDYIRSEKLWNSPSILKLSCARHLRQNSPSEPLPAGRMPVLHLDSEFPRQCGRRQGGEDALCTAWKQSDTLPTLEEFGVTLLEKFEKVKRSWNTDIVLIYNMGRKMVPTS